MTSLHLAPPQQQLLAQALTDLLSPGAHPTVDAWRLTASRSVSQLLGADWSGFVARARGIGECWTEAHPLFIDYVQQAAGFDRKVGLWKRQELFTVWNRARLWGRFLPEMRKSSYYHEFIKPLRAYDTIGLSLRPGPDAPLFSIHLMHDSPRGTRFGERGLALLRLLEPSFRVGTGAATRHFGLVSSTGRKVRYVGSSRLSRREREVADLLARRRSNHEIADTLGVRPATVKRHVEHVLAKLGLHSRRDVERVMIDS